MLAYAAVSIARLAPEPLKDQPAPDAQECANSAWELGHGFGYVTSIHDSPVHPSRLNPPRYPPSLALILAPFADLGVFPADVQVGSKAIAVAYIVAIGCSAATLGGPVAGLAVTMMVIATPFVSTSAELVMSDCLAALAAVVLLPLNQE